MKFHPARWLYQFLYSVQFDLHKALLKYKLKQISSSLKGTWLDIGAGDQPYKKFFLSADAYLTTNTKRHYSVKDIEKLDQTTTYWIDDGKKIPVDNCSVDGVACFQVLSVIDKPEEFFKEINRILKPGGKLIMSTDFMYPVWSNEDRLRHTAFSLEQLCTGSGFSNIKIESFGGFTSLIYSLFMRYMRSFPEAWQNKGFISKVFSAFIYLILLAFLPIASIKGYFIYLLERNSNLNNGFTFNLFLTAEKV